MLTHPSEVTLSRTLSYLPIRRVEDWLEATGGSFHIGEAQPCWGWHSWETVLQFFSPWLYTQRDCAGCHLRLTLGGRQAMCQHLPSMSGGNKVPTMMRGQKKFPLRIRWVLSRSGSIIGSWVFMDLESICPVQSFSCSIRSCILYLWHLASFLQAHHCYFHYSTRSLSSKSCVTLVFPLLWAFSGWTWLVLKDMDSRTRQLELKSTFSIY